MAIEHLKCGLYKQLCILNFKDLVWKNKASQFFYMHVEGFLIFGVKLISLFIHCLIWLLINFKLHKTLWF